MHYKTITLELLQQRPQLQDQFRRNRSLLATLELYARQLKTHHEAWKDHLSRARPGSDPSQVASEALEIALQELEDFLGPSDDSEPLSAEGAITFIRGHTPPRRP
jgi:hypothetical protein